jgi:hypothetical protein
MRHGRLVIVAFATGISIAGLLAFVPRHRNYAVRAAATISPEMKALFQSQQGGMGPYISAISGATTAAQNLQAVSDLNTYMRSRSNWSMSSDLVTRLANADWQARQAGPPRITPTQAAAAATSLINSVLGSMTAAEQQSMLAANAGEQTPKVHLGFNANVPNVSAVQGADGKWVVTVAPEAFSRRKAALRSLGAAMTDSSNFYPSEVLVTAYSLASGDMGFGNDFLDRMRKGLTDLTGLDMTNRVLFGDSGYLVRRPLQRFLTSVTLNTYFSALGF